MKLLKVALLLMFGSGSYGAEETAVAGIFELRRVSGSATAGTIEMQLRHGENYEKMHVEKVPLLTGRGVKTSAVRKDPLSGQTTIEIQFTEEGAKEFATLTERLVGQRIAVLLDGKVHTAPVINEKIAGGRVILSGNLTDEQARDLVQRINSAARNSTPKE